MAFKSRKDINLACVEQNSNPRVEGIITAISPMKAGKSCNYYDGGICDDHSSLKFCRFIVTAHS